jgi:hypothetical protein
MEAAYPFVALSGADGHSRLTREMRRQLKETSATPAAKNEICWAGCGRRWPSGVE